MSSTPNHSIPYVPEGTLDPAAGLNLSLNVIDALVQTAVIAIGVDDPPATNSDGDLYIVGTGTGAWVGLDDRLVRYVAESDSWQSFVPGIAVNYVFNKDDGEFYVYNLLDSPPGWTILVGGGGGGGASLAIDDEDSPSIDITAVERITFAGNALVSEVAPGHARVEIPDVVDASTVSAPTNASGTVTLDASKVYHTHLMTANVTTLAFSNLPGSGHGATLMLRITQDSTPRTFAWPASFKWAGGTPPSISTGSGAVDVLAITTFDNGTTWDATLAKAFS